MLLLFAALVFQDIARPVPPEVVRQMPFVYVVVPFVKPLGILPVWQMVWVEVPNPNYVPNPEA
jgi:hypothetical protein